MNEKPVPPLFSLLVNERSMTMITKIQFQKDATVLAADGRTLGSLKRVVLNPESNVVTNVVVRTGSLIKREEKVVPIGMVAETADRQILLREEAGELEALSPFEERRLVNEHGGRVNPTPSQSSPPMTTGYSIIGTQVVPMPDNPIITRIEQNIPEGNVALKEGARVISADGKHVGAVERVFAEPVADQITYLGISKGFLVKETMLIPMKWVLRVGEEEVHLRVSMDSVENTGDLPVAE